MEALAAALAAYLVAHPRALAVVVESFGILSLIAFAWKAIPEQKRAAWEVRYPRRVGVLRFVCRLAPEFIGMFFAARQVANGLPKRPEREPVDPLTIDLTRGSSRVAVFPLPEITVHPPSDPPPAIVVDAVTAPVVRPLWVVALSALLAALAFAVLVAVAIGQSGCSAQQRTDEMAYVREVVVVAKAYAKATCRAVQMPGAEQLASIVVPGVISPMAFAAARLVCAIFIDDQQTESVSVAVMSDGRVEPL